jgi:hypothetical protein
MQLNLHVTTNDGDDYTVTTNLFVVVAWERKYKRKASELSAGIGVLQTVQCAGASSV